MKLVIDKAIPFIEGVFEPYAEVRYLEGSGIGKADLADADGLVTRSRTLCNADILEGSKLGIIATATIGTGHIDLPWCESHGIFVTTSAGSNAGAVMNYVFSALFGVAARKGIMLSGATFGVIGAGNVGKRVAAMARTLGFKVLVHDPMKSAQEGGPLYCSLDELLDSSDVVSMHTSLTPDSENMADYDFFAKMKSGGIFINTAHGATVCDDALIGAREKLGAIIIDTWRNEPNINLDLLRATDIATPHIAGYSYQGKQLSTALAVRSIARFFSISELYGFFPPTDIKELEAVKLDFHGMTQGQIASMIQYNYPVFTDDFMFRINPGNFTQLRDSYQYRKEFYTD